MPRVHIGTFDGVEEREVCGPLEVFSALARAHPVMVQPVSDGKAAEVIHSLGMKGVPVAPSAHDVALVVVPGGRAEIGTSPSREAGSRTSGSSTTVTWCRPYRISLVSSAELRRVV
ncbi:hypothetical protein [Streptomyces europaeiscabiei]|uniref:hypothetical protein n=1 Tax=Streptomyces europaeiscabiei TaxID=146819 RepID=UPI002E18A918